MQHSDQYIINGMERFYYEVNKIFLEGLESEYGLPDTIVTRSWTTVTTSIDNTKVIIETTEPLDSLVILSPVLDEAQANERIMNGEYPITD